MDNIYSYDFLGSIYKNTTREELYLCLNSISKQTLKPEKVVLVIDGPIKFNLSKVINDFNKLLNIILVKLPYNKGLGNALRNGLKFCTATYILRFDSDDYNMPCRAEEQINFMINKNLDISSSNIFEFIDNPNRPVSYKNVPLTNRGIKFLLPFRNPFNHPSICFKLASIINIDGGYRNCPFYEDYDLWIRAISKDLRCENIEKRLVGMKVNELIRKRKGIKMIFFEAKLIKTFWDYSFKNLILFVPVFLLRSIIRLMPNKFLYLIYKKILRSEIY